MLNTQMKTSNRNSKMKNARRCRGLLPIVAFLATVVLSSRSLQATVVLPYTSDGDTFLLYHLNDTPQGTSNTVVDSGPYGVNLRQQAGGAGSSPFRGIASPVVLSTPDSDASTSARLTTPANGGGQLYRANYADIFTDIATNDPLPMSNSTFTVEAWIKPFDLDTLPASRTLFDIRQSNRSLVLVLNDSNQLVLSGIYRNNTGGSLTTGTIATSNAITFEEDTWYHFAVTYDYAGDATPATVQFYLDPETNVTANPTRPGTILGTSSSVDSYGINQFVKTTTNDDFNFGTLGGLVNDFQGDVDEFRWSNVVRSEFNLAFVPEPGSFAMLLFGSVMLLAVRRKRG